MNNTTKIDNIFKQKIIFIKSILITIFFILFLQQAPTVKAETVIFEDDFSNGLEKWEAARDHFDLWSIVDGRADVYVNSGSTLTELVPKDEYWSPDYKNLIYELDYNLIKGGDSNISWGFQDTKNWYEIHFANGNYQLVHVVNGRVVWNKTGRGWSGQVHIKVVFDKGRVAFTINGNTLVDEVDPTFNDSYGKIAMKVTTGSIYPTHATFDNIVVKSLDNLETKLNVPMQKQTDLVWASQEYDTASTWSNQTGIDRWGCALTSASMIFNYHNINTLPNGETVTPESLNNWLNSQTDGYIGKGLVNWIALTRLTKLINETAQTPKLEYLRTQGDNLYLAKTELENNKPSILQITGHFLVAAGIVNGSEWSETEGNPDNDLYINDPAFDFTKFSEHQTPLLSTRTFQPSFTDLSYLHLNYTHPLTATMTYEDGSTINSLQNFADYLQEFNVDNEDNFIPKVSPTIQISEVAKPVAATYHIQLTRDTLAQDQVTIFTYDTTGTLTDLSYSGLIGQAGITLQLNYNNDGQSELVPLVNLQTFINDLDELLARHEVRKHFVYQELKQLANFAKDSENGDRERYLSALETTLNYYSSYLSTNAFSLLNQRLVELGLE